MSYPDEEDSCGWPCPKCDRGRCIKSPPGHRSHHVCSNDRCRHSWRT